jgi:hypothetical protein
MHSCWISYAKLLCLLAAMPCTLLALASPTPGALMSPAGALLHRQTADGPQFPDEPKSCPICARDYWDINSCCQAAPILANFTNVSYLIVCTPRAHWCRNSCIGNLQPRSLRRCHYVRMWGYIPVRLSAMRGLVRICSSPICILSRDEANYDSFH